MEFLKICSFAICLAGVTFFSGMALSESCDTPLPDDLSIKAPLPSVPESHKKFSGRWSGKWGGMLCHNLIVENVTDDGRATVVYSWGTYSKWNVYKGHARWNGVFDGDTLVFAREGLTVKYWFSENKLEGTYQRKDWDRPNRITMSRM